MWVNGCGEKNVGWEWGLRGEGEGLITNSPSLSFHLPPAAPTNNKSLTPPYLHTPEHTPPCPPVQNVEPTVQIQIMDFSNPDVETDNDELNLERERAGRGKIRTSNGNTTRDYKIHTLDL